MLHSAFILLSSSAASAARSTGLLHYCWWRCLPSSPGTSASRNPCLFNREERVGDTISAHTSEDSKFGASYGGDLRELSAGSDSSRTSWERLGTSSGSWQGRATPIRRVSRHSSGGSFPAVPSHPNTDRNTCRLCRTGRGGGGHLATRGSCPFACDGFLHAAVLRSYLSLVRTCDIVTSPRRRV